jgi:hypothetical protein
MALRARERVRGRGDAGRRRCVNTIDTPCTSRRRRERWQAIGESMTPGVHPARLEFGCARSFDSGSWVACTIRWMMFCLIDPAPPRPTIDIHRNMI